MEKYSMYNYKLDKQLLEKELKKLALFKLGDPVIINYYSLQLSIKILDIIGSKNLNNFIITGPPPNKIPSSSHILIKKVSKKLNIECIFPKRLISATGYSKLRTSSEKKEHIVQQFTYHGIKTTKYPIVVDDVYVSGEMFLTLNKKFYEFNKTYSKYLFIIWDFNSLPINIESSIIDIIKKDSKYFFERIIYDKWYFTSGLEKNKKYF